MQSTDVGASWDIAVINGSTSDLSFKTYVQSDYAASGIFVSSAKDANPSPTGSPEWGTLSWGGSVPANTTLNFQAAANNDLSGTFNFVGPDGTANSFFNNGDPLSQFNGLRYLKYKAFLNTSDSSVTAIASENGNDQHDQRYDADCVSRGEMMEWKAEPGHTRGYRGNQEELGPAIEAVPTQ